MIASNDILSNPDNFTPPMQTSQCALHAAKHAGVVKISEFLSEFRRAK